MREEPRWAGLGMLVGIVGLACMGRSGYVGWDGLFRVVGEGGFSGSRWDERVRVSGALEVRTGLRGPRSAGWGLLVCLSLRLADWCYALSAG